MAVEESDGLLRNQQKARHVLRENQEKLRTVLEERLRLLGAVERYFGQGRFSGRGVLFHCHEGDFYLERKF